MQKANNGGKGTNDFSTVNCALLLGGPAGESKTDLRAQLSLDRTSLPTVNETLIYGLTSDSCLNFLCPYQYPILEVNLSNRMKLQRIKLFPPIL